MATVYRGVTPSKTLTEEWLEKTKAAYQELRCEYLDMPHNALRARMVGKADLYYATIQTVYRAISIGQVYGGRERRAELEKLHDSLAAGITTMANRASIYGESDHAHRFYGMSQACSELSDSLAHLLGR